MIKYFLFIILVGCLVSCRSVKNTVVRKDVANIPEGRLFKNIYSNELVYNTLYSKKMDISAGLNGKNMNLKAVMKVQRDSFIWISVVAPLGIEVARVLLTRDSIKLIDSFNRKYFLSDYSFFYNKFGAHITYDCCQKILTNIFFNLESCNGTEKKDERFKFERTDRDYVLSNVQTKAIDRKIKKFFKKKRKNKDYALVLQTIHIDPEYFRPSGLTLDDLEDDFGVSATYNDFKDYNGHIFPEEMLFKLSFGDADVKLKLKFMKLEFDVEVAPNFNVPSRYKRMSL